MILRKISDHLKSQNWLAVILDFLIVVVGIFVGMQVTNWNEGLKEQEKSRIMTERLTQDLKEEAWNYQYLTEYYDDVESNLALAISVMETNIALSDEEFLIAAYRATQYNIDYRIRATFDELTASGDLDLIKDDDLIKTAIHVYNFELFKTLRSNGQNSKYREKFRMTVPIAAQKALLENCGDIVVKPFDYTAIIDSLDYPCKLGLSKDEVSSIVSTIKTDKEFLSLMRLRYSQLNSNMTSLTKQFPQVRLGLQALREEA